VSVKKNKNEGIRGRMNTGHKKRRTEYVIQKKTTLYFFTAKPQLQTHAITVKKSESFGKGASNVNNTQLT